MSAPLPDNEAARLDALRRCDVLDTPPEQAFDDIARLAAYICGTPIAAVSLVDAERQWCKSILGITDREMPREMSFCAHTILQPDLTIVRDTQDDPRFATNPLVNAEPNIRFYAGAPLLSDDGYALGALCIIDRKPRTLTPEQQDALRMLASQVSSQLRAGHRLAERERLLFEKERADTERRRAEESLRQSHDALQRSQRRLAEAQRIAQIGSWEYDIEAARITWSDELFRLFEMDPAQGEPSVEELMTHYHPEDVAHHQAITGQAIQDGKPYEFDTRILLPGGSVRWAHAIGRGERDETGRIARLFGTLMNIHDRKVLEESLRDYSVVLEFQKNEMEKANAALEELATTDSLTGLCNRRIFQDRLAEEVRRAHRYGTPVSLIMLDIDGFKSYNDTHGHPEGDIALRTVAHILETCARNPDVVCRYGGEEFVLLLPQTDCAGAVAYAERLRTTVEKHAWSLRPVTASLGVAALRLGEAGADLVARADAALYRAKTSGRNRVVGPSDALASPTPTAKMR